MKIATMQHCKFVLPQPLYTCQSNKKTVSIHIYTDMRIIIIQSRMPKKWITKFINFFNQHIKQKRPLTISLMWSKSIKLYGKHLAYRSMTREAWSTHSTFDLTAWKPKKLITPDIEYLKGIKSDRKDIKTFVSFNALFKLVVMNHLINFAVPFKL